MDNEFEIQNRVAPEHHFAVSGLDDVELEINASRCILRLAAKRKCVVTRLFYYKSERVKLLVQKLVAENAMREFDFTFVPIGEGWSD